MHRTTVRAVLAAAAVIAVGAPSAAIGFGEGKRLRLGERNPSSNATLALTNETEIIAENETYGTRQSNKKDGDGGGAIYGCRSNPGNEPCIRSNNLKGGRAFEFATAGKEGGRIDLGDPAGAPLTTNATGVATGFNADKVDGKDADAFAAAADLRWASVDATGKLVAGRGATEAKLLDATTNTFSVTFDREVKECSWTAGRNAATADAKSGADSAQAIVPAAGDDTKTVLVDQVDAPATPKAFHLQVIC